MQYNIISTIKAVITITIVIRISIGFRGVFRGLGFPQGMVWRNPKP